MNRLPSIRGFFLRTPTYPPDISRMTMEQQEHVSLMLIAYGVPVHPGDIRRLLFELFTNGHVHHIIQRAR